MEHMWGDSPMKPHAGGVSSPRGQLIENELRNEVMMTAPAATETLVLDWLASQRDAMLDLVRALVDIDSGSYDKAGVDAVGARLRTFLAAHDVASSIIANDRFGDAIRAQVNNVAGAAANAPVLLLGHRDTVFPAGESGRRPFRVVDGLASGPGCCDMKA